MSKRESPHWIFDERLEGEDMDPETAVAPITKRTAIPLALPVSMGDKITIHYPEDTPDDFGTRDNPEVWHFGGFRGDGVKLVHEDDHNRAIREAESDSIRDIPTIHGCVTEGAYRFNERVMKHAEKVEVERVEVPEFYNVR